MEFGTIEREIYVDASPKIVFDVVSSPDHLRQWWPDEAQFETSPGSTGEIVFGHREAGTQVLDIFTEWKSVYVDYSGKLQRAQIDEVNFE